MGVLVGKRLGRSVGTRVVGEKEQYGALRSVHGLGVTRVGVLVTDILNVGKRVGANVGVCDGKLVGRMVGTGVFCHHAVGTRVRPKIGIAVGGMVGVRVGKEVGFSVGTAVAPGTVGPGVPKNGN